ncbi:MAG: glycosyltransferase family 39 protein [Candidatus Diapherotrites archaeon]
MKLEKFFQDKKTIFLIVILLLAFCIRVFNLSYRQAGVDEELTIRVTKSFEEAIAFSNSDFYPPLSYVLMVPVVSLLGGFWARFFFALVGTLAVFLFYFLAKAFFSEQEALLSTLLFAFNPLNVFYSVNLRHYVFLLLLSLLAMLAMISLLKKFSMKSLALFCASLVLMGYINYVCWAYAIAALVFFLFFLKDKKFFKECVGGMALVLLCLAFLLPLAISQFNNFSKSHYFAQPFNPLIYPYAFYKLAVGVNISSALNFFPPLLFVVPIVLVLFVYGAILFWRQKNEVGRFIFFFFIVSATLLALGSIKSPMLFSFRYLFPLMPAFIIFLSKGIFSFENFKALSLTAFIILLWLIAIFYYFLVSSLADWNAFIGL